MLSFVDTHCHLQLICEKLGGLGELPKILQACQKEKVENLLTLTASLEELQGLLELVDAHDFIFGALGVHPHNAAEMQEKHFRFIQEHIHHPKISAVGEIGLDYHYELSPREIQKKIFRRFLELALDEKKPVVIHTRDAEEDTKTILEPLGASLRGVVHCFTGSLNLAEFILKNCPNIALGFTGVITFKNATAIRDVVRKAPLNRIFIETDSPFMAPEPHRGKINSPSYVPLVAAKIAEIKGTTVDKVLEITNENCQYLFQGKGVVS